MSKSVVVLIFVFVFLSGSVYFWRINVMKNSFSKDQSTFKINSILDIDDLEKIKIADAIIEGRNLFRSGNVDDIRKYLIASKPDKNFDQLPDSAIQSLSAFLVNNKENFEKNDILKSTQWGINNGRVYVIVQSGSLTSRLEVIKVGDKWYRY